MSNALAVSTEMFMCFILSFVNMVYHIDWLMWNHSCIPRINPTWSWCVNLLCIVEFGLLVFCWEFFPFFKIYFLTGGKLLYNVVLVSAIQNQWFFCNYTHMTSLLSLPALSPSRPSRSSQSRTSLCYIAISHQLF